VHLQLYPYTELSGQAVASAFGPLATPLAPLARAAAARLIIVQGFLHSYHSSRIAAVLQKGAAGQPDLLRLTAEPNPESKPIIRRVLRKLARHALRIGGFPIVPMLQIAEAGRSFHTGGAFPMQAQPGPLESDSLGRRFGWQRVHVVDASVLPSIPATTITLSVMANAHRIGWESAG
jgi:choline dehydrogenase-like flavoprotein